MAEALQMPRQGLSVESSFLTKWHKEIGDEIKEGDLLITFETDKSTFDMEAEIEGVLLAKFFEEGEEVAVLTNIGAVGEVGEDYEDLKPQELIEEDIKSEEETKKIVDKKRTQVSVEDEVEEIKYKKPEVKEDVFKISPRAIKLSEKNSIFHEMAIPTGPEGRIIERDIQKLIDEGPVFTPAALKAYKNMKDKPSKDSLTGTGLGGKITIKDLQITQEKSEEKIMAGELVIPENIEYEEVEMSNIRKNIAKAMHDSLQTTAQLTLNTSFDASSILKYRKKIKAFKEELELSNITLNSMILYAVAKTLLDHEQLNAHLVDNRLHIYKHVQLGMAVDTERGLMVPTIFDADLKSLNTIGKESLKLAKKCQEGSINPDYLKGASFTITNLGSLDIESFTPVINPPQIGILGVNTIEYKIKKNTEGEFVEYPAMGLSLTIDHQAIDGAPAARFLKDLSNNLEKFELMLSK